MFYVTMTDRFLSGWGKSDGKINKIVFECDTMMQAQVVKMNAIRRGDQKYINIVSNKPSYPSKTHYTQFKTQKDYPRWYEEGYFMAN